MPIQPFNREDQISELKDCIHAIKKRLDLIRPLYERSMDKVMQVEIKSLEVQYTDLTTQLKDLLNESYQINDMEMISDDSKRKAIDNSSVIFDKAERISSEVTPLKKVWEPVEIRRSNSMFCDISNSVKTVPLMDRFQASDKEYLLLGGIAPQYGIRDVYLVVHRFHVNIPHINSGLMLSELKKNGRGKLRKGLRDGAESLGDLNPWYPLCKEYNSDNVAVLQSQNYFFFSKAIEFGAQTSLDRKGYGSVYQGGKTDFEGTRYGETTSFLIVGATLTLTE